MAPVVSEPELIDSVQWGQLHYAAFSMRVNTAHGYYQEVYYNDGMLFIDEVSNAWPHPGK